MNNKNKSFTLIELLVVIVIIGILAGVIMISTSSSIDKANFAKVKVFEESVQNNLAANMVSRWKLNGDFNDSWGSSNGTNYGTTFLNELECVSGQCGNFNGSSYIDCGNNTELDVIEKTIELWIKTKVNGVGVIGQSGGSGQWLLTIRSNNLAWDTWATGPDMQGYTSIIDNRWHHLVIVVSDINNRTTFYLDSSIERTDSGSVSTPAASGNFFIGSCDMVAGTTWCANLSLSNFNGYMDEIKVYNAALSSSQIKQNYIAGLDSLLSKNLISKEEYNQRIKGLSSK